MIQDILLTILGFPCEFVEEAESAPELGDSQQTYRVKPGYSKLSDSEKDQINKIVPLGFYYTYLEEYVRKYELGWGVVGSETQLYKAALSMALQELLQEYTQDIADFEQLLFQEQSIPLSHLLQHVQKYLIVFPQLHTMLKTIEESGVRGCQLIDFFAKYACGVPVLTDLIERIIYRLRIPLLKQIFSWMVFGHVDDDAKEFFIQHKTNPTSNSTFSSYQHLTAEQRILSQLAQAKLQTDQASTQYRSHAQTQANGENFNWYSTYSLRMENIPDSHISSSLASKIIFAGKAAKLLQTTPIHKTSRRQTTNSTNNNNNKSEAFEYLSRGNDFDLSSADLNQPPQDDGKSHKSTLDSLLTIIPDMPYSREEIEYFDSQFKLIFLHEKDDGNAVEKLEKTIDIVSQTISTRLWTLLKDHLGFVDHLHIIRNTYLMGKGELMQCIVDDLHVLMHQTTPEKEAESLDEILNFSVLRHASKLLGFADEDLGKILQLRIQSNNVSISQYHREDDRLVTMIGAASHAYPLTTTTTQQSMTGGKGIFNPIGINLCIPTSPPEAELYRKLWKDRYILNLSSTNGTGENAADDSSPWSPHAVEDQQEEGEENAEQQRSKQSQRQKEPKYLNAAVWLTDTKFVSKGFHFAVTFSSSWTHAHLMNRQHLLILHSQRARERLLWPKLPSELHNELRQKDIVLGTIATCLHGDNRNLSTLGSGELCRHITQSLLIGVSFHACQLHTADGSSSDSSVKYYARIFVARGGDEGMIKLPLDRKLQVNIGDGYALHKDRDTSSQDQVDSILGENIIDLDNNLNLPSIAGVRSVRTVGNSMRLEVSYLRVLQYHQHQAGAAGGSVASSTTNFTTAARTTVNMMGEVSYRLRVRLIDTDAINTESVNNNAGSGHWDLDLPIDLAMFVKLQGGQAWLGTVASGLIIQQPEALTILSSVATDGNNNRSVVKMAAFDSTLHTMRFEGKGTLHSFPVCSPYTSARYPDTFLRLEEEMAKMRTWLQLKVQVQLPPLFQVIFDAESMRHYERIFALLMKIRLVARLLEKLWMSRSKTALPDRLFCNIRHTMHFFISNLLYYLQVDVVDSEYAALQQELLNVKEFQAVLQAHRHFLANILRLTMLDNIGIQECYDRLLHLCLRFVAACRLQSLVEHQQDLADEHQSAHLLRQHQRARKQQAQTSASSAPPVYIPQEEFENIRKEFFQQLSFLLQFMRRVESRGFLFRLDFNGFLSQQCYDISS